MKCLICMVRRVPKSFDHLFITTIERNGAFFFAQTCICSREKLLRYNENSPLISKILSLVDNSRWQTNEPIKSQRGKTYKSCPDLAFFWILIGWGSCAISVIQSQCVMAIKAKAIMQLRSTVFWNGWSYFSFSGTIHKSPGFNFLLARSLWGMLA